MRVIVGRHRGRRLETPAGKRTRPILDRVKQALFDRLGSMHALPGELPAWAVLDLYAGGGSLGIEALSRGACWCCFVESDRAALPCLRRNLAALGIEGQSVVVADAAEIATIPAPAGGGYGLIFLDPPYRLSDERTDSGPLERVIDRLGRDVPVAAGATLVWRYGHRAPPPPRLGTAWALGSRQEYRTMTVAFYEYAAT